MNDLEQNEFERDLRRLKPARLPHNLLARLQRSTDALARPTPAGASRADRNVRAPDGTAAAHGQTSGRRGPLWLWPRVLAPAAAVAVLLGAWWHRHPVPPGPGRGIERVSKAAALPIEAGQVEIARELVGTFDALARLPDGEPIRLRCREWRDNVVLSDLGRGVVVERERPRIEVVAVNFETY